MKKPKVSKKSRQFIENYKTVNSIPRIEIPYEIARVIPSLQLDILHAEVCLSKDGDFVSLEQAQAAVIWLANQLGLDCK